MNERNEYHQNSVNFNRMGHFDPRPTAHQLDSDEISVAELQQILELMPAKSLCHYQLLERPIVDEIYPDIRSTYNIAERRSVFFEIL